MFALESAMDELAVALGIDPVELRIRNEPEVDPESGVPFTSRNLVACLREGARAVRLGGPRPARRGARRDGRWLVGTGVAASTYPARAAAVVGAAPPPRRTGRFTVRINATDIGTGARTALCADRRRRARGAAGAGRDPASATARCRRRRVAGRLDGHRRRGAGR